MSRQKPAVGDRVWILDGGRRKQRTVIAMHPEESDACYVDSAYYTKGKPARMYTRFDELYYDEGDAMRGEKRWDYNYDNYIDPLHYYH